MIVKSEINILYIESGIGFGGAVTCLAAQIKTLDKNKYSLIVVSSHNDSASKNVIELAGAKFIYAQRYKRSRYIKERIEAAQKYGQLIKKIFLLFVFLAESLLKIPYLLDLLFIIKKHKADIIYMNNNIELNMEGVIASRILKIPCISHLRGPEYPSLEAKIASKYINFFITMSDFVKKSLLNIKVPQNKIRTIYDGVNINECVLKSDFAQCDDAKNYKYGRFNIGLVGCLVDWKGHDVFIEAANILANELNRKDCKYFIIGGMPCQSSPLKKKLQELVAKYRLSESMVFTGHQANVFPFISKMDTIVHASIKPEPFGRVIIEAMALGKPVIATKIGGPLEIITNGVDGLLIRESDPRALAVAIHGLLNDTNRRKNISTAASRKVKERFELSNTVNKIEDIYAEVMQCA